MKRKKIRRSLLAAIVALILIVVIPIAINELYKKNTGYMTIWGAADVLSYYGTILGACVTVGALIVTILFTKKQIQRDSFIKNQEEKWSRIEALVFSSLEKIHPTRISEIISKVDSGKFSNTITELHLFSFQAKTALDSLFGYISGDDYKKLEPLLTSIQTAADEYCEVVTKLSAQYQKLIQLEIRRNALSMYNTAMQNPTRFMNDLVNSKRILDETANLNEDEIWAEIRALSGQLNDMRDDSYRGLLERKRTVFADINDQWAKEADNMLHLWRN